jgi:hypothetical protein
MSNGDNVAGAVIVGGLGLMGAVVLASAVASARQQITTTTPTIPTRPPTGEQETQVYTFADGSTEAKITFPEGTRYVKMAEIEVTPTLEDGGSPAPGQIGYLYIIIQEHGKLPELYRWSDGSTDKAVSAGVHYEFDVPINKYLDMLLVRIRKMGVATRMNDLVITLTKI